MFHKLLSKSRFISVLIFIFISVCKGSISSKSYELTIPEKWKQDISVGKLTIEPNAFYGIMWDFGLYPIIQLKLPVENLTTETLYLNMNYRTESKIRGYGNSGMGVCYTLNPKEKRLINTIVPIASMTWPIRFLLRMYEPSRSLDSSGQTRETVVTIDPFEVNKSISIDDKLINLENDLFEVQKVEVKHLNEQGNCVVFDIKNKTDRELPLGIYVSVNDPINIETKGVLARPHGFIYDSIETIPANKQMNFTIPYDIPPIGPNPALVYTLFVPRNENMRLNDRDKRRWDTELVGYGLFNLVEAAKQGNCIIPQHLSVEERANLTLEKKSEHFLFKYRPDSYAEKNIEKVVSEREAAYRKLSEVLKMELPVTVQIDLYPDMEAKALGSGTAWTPANTRNNKHICEVYNEEYQCDSFHELAHIFSYHFPNYSSNKGGIVEAFAAYFETNNMPIGPTKAILKRQLNEGELSSLTDILQSESSSRELVILIDFLLNKDVEKFKEFYVVLARAPEMGELEKAIQLIYGTDLKGLERQWHKYLNKDTDTK